MNIRVEIMRPDKESVSPLLLDGEAWLQAISEIDPILGEQKDYVLHLGGVSKKLVAEIARSIERGWISAIFVGEGELERCLYPVTTDFKTKLTSVKLDENKGKDKVVSRRIKRSKPPEGDGWKWGHSGKATV